MRSPLAKATKPVASITTNRERPITIAKACGLFEAAGHSKSQMSIYRYAARGLRGVRLETVLDGGRILTSKQAVKRFLQAQAVARESRYGLTPLEATKRKKLS